MSIKLMTKAWEMPIPTGQKMLLLALCDHANDDGACYPSQEKLAEKCSMSKRAVVSHIKWLLDHGVIVRERRQKTNVRQANLYQINLDNFSESANSACANSACANSACANSACANSACANSAPPKVQILHSASANSALSYKEEPSIEPSIEPSVGCVGVETPSAPTEILTDGQPPNASAKSKAANAQTWEAYRQAYLQRYGVEPIRNAQANALIANLVKAVGAREAAGLAAFYVSHNKGWYVQNRHALKHLIGDIQAIRTDWLMREQMTAQKARQTERTQANLESHNGAMDILKQKYGL